MAAPDGPPASDEGHLVSVRDLTRDRIDAFLDDAQRHAKALDGGEPQRIAEDRVLATLFYEPSTRTRLSFESAMQRLGGTAISVTDAQATSVVKGESLADTARVVSGYADAIVLRHPREGSARLAARFASIPVVNAGDGAGEHPTQTLTDLYTIREATGSLDGVRVILSGDLRYGRTIHSLALALATYDAEIVLVPPTEEFDLPQDLAEEVVERGATLTRADTIEDELPGANILYQTRLQEERFEGQGVRPQRVTVETLREASPDLKIMHPLPRVDEIAPEVDGTGHAAYFEQAHNGLPVRMAVLANIFQEARR